MKDLLDRLFVRLPEIRALAGSLGHARERLSLERQDPEALALDTIRTAWHNAPEAAPAVLVADLVAESWMVLAEESLAKGSPERCVLALEMADAAFLEGSGDAYLAAHSHAVWALYHRAQGEGEEALRSLTHLARVGEAIHDPQLRAEAELWTYLFEREQGRDQEAEQALVRAGARLTLETRSAQLAGLAERMTRAPAGPGSQPPPASPQGPIANGHPVSPPDPALEDTWEEPRPEALREGEDPCS